MEGAADPKQGAGWSGTGCSGTGPADPSTGPAPEPALGARPPRQGERGRGVARVLRRLLLAGAVLALAACSSLKLAYDNADTLLAYTFDRYFDLDEQQTALLRERLRAVHAWHRATQLADITELANQAVERLGTADAGTPIAAADITRLQQRAAALARRLGTRVAPDLARLALTLRPEQIERCERQFAKDHLKTTEEVLPRPGHDTVDERARLWADRLETWLGRLSSAQLAAVREAVARNPDLAAAWVVEREQRRQDLLALLRRIEQTRPDVTTAASWFEEYFEQMTQPLDAARAARVAEQAQASAALMARLLNIASPDHREALANRLRGYAEDLTTLAARATAKPTGTTERAGSHVRGG